MAANPHDEGYSEAMEVMLQDLGVVRREVLSTQDDRTRLASDYQKRLFNAQNRAAQSETDPAIAEQKNAWKSLSDAADHDTEGLGNLDDGMSYRYNKFLAEQESRFGGGRGGRGGHAPGRGGFSFTAGRGRGGSSTGRGGFEPQQSHLRSSMNASHAGDARVTMPRHQAPSRGNLSSRPPTLGGHIVSYPPRNDGRSSPHTVAGSSFPNDARTALQSQQSHHHQQNKQLSSAHLPHEQMSQSQQQRVTPTAIERNQPVPTGPNLQRQSQQQRRISTAIERNQPVPTEPNLPRQSQQQRETPTATERNQPVSTGPTMQRSSPARRPVPMLQQAQQYISPVTKKPARYVATTELADSSSFLQARDSVFKTSSTASTIAAAAQQPLSRPTGNNTAGGDGAIIVTKPVMAPTTMAQPSAPASLHSRRPSVASIASTSTSRNRPLPRIVELATSDNWLQKRDQLFARGTAADTASKNQDKLVSLSAPSPTAGAQPPLAVTSPTRFVVAQTPASLFAADRAAAHPGTPQTSAPAAAPSRTVISVTTLSTSITEETANSSRADSVLGNHDEVEEAPQKPSAHNEPLISLIDEVEQVPPKASAHNDLLGLTFAMQKHGLQGSRWAD